MTKQTKTEIPSEVTRVRDAATGDVKTTYLEWLDNLKAGDEVVIGRCPRTTRIYTVERVTPTQIILPGDHGRYGRYDGFAIKEHWRGRIQRVTDDLRSQVLINEFENIKWQRFTLNTLRTIKQSIERGHLR